MKTAEELFDLAAEVGLWFSATPTNAYVHWEGREPKRLVAALKRNGAALGRAIQGANLAIERARQVMKVDHGR